ncbi:DDT domain-containing protein PTM-like [Rutidosis leptorrhynchoides]|uniref:DDT domain-containing protein PTM-like n=1 Tax=Rutidosis leptorrhynchoides TaxID=125765 RepID=UPI003A993C43
MEFVGRTVRKELKGIGVFNGTVKSYDLSTKLFEIGYEDRDSEEIDHNELSALIEFDGVCTDQSQSQSQSRVLRRPKKKARVFGESNKGNEIDVSSSNSNAVTADDSNLNNGSVDCDNLNLSDGKGNGNDDVIDLNLNDGNDLAGIDLNMELDDHENKNEDVDLGGYVKGEICAEETRVEEQTGNVSISDISPIVDDDDDENPGKTFTGGGRGRKRRKILDSPKMGGESVLRRSARRQAKLSAEDDTVSAVKYNGDDGGVPSSASPVIRARSSRRRAKLSSYDNIVDTVKCNGDDNGVLCGASPVISAVSEEQPTVSGCEESEEPSKVSLNLELPPSTGNLNLDGLPVLGLFSVYAFLRSFSTILHLSPFGLGDFVASIRSKSPNLLIDSVHVSLLRILRKNLEFQSREGSTSATSCLRDLNWDLVDLITWPIFLAEYLLMKPGFNLSHLGLFKTDYHSQSEFVKVEILQYICDDVIEGEAISSELNRRILIGERVNAVDANSKTKLVASKKRRSISEEVIDETADLNSDECCLCKMDGNLICCDGCPAAFHSKCVGIATNLLPEGDWYCPECVVDKKNPEISVAKLIRGADLLGVDPDGRLYYSSCGYLLVSHNSDAETSFHYYYMNDLTALVSALNLLDGSYRTISNAITKHWRVYTKFIGGKTKLDSENISLCADPYPNMATESSGFCAELEKPLAHSGSSELSEVVVDVRKSSKNVLHSFKKSSGVNGKNICSFNSGYLNLYSFARIASTVAKEWAPKLLNKTSQTPTKSLEELISMQMKAITKTSVDFCWSNMQNLSVDARKEKCGWCLACKYPTDDGNCLFYMNNPTDLESFTSELIGFDSRITRKDRLIDLMCHILYIEDRLHGLLLGPWLSPKFPKLYRKSYLEASYIVPVKELLLTLEANIWPRAISDDWLKQVDSVVTVGSASHFVASKFRANSRNVIGRKRPALDSESRSLKNPLSGLVLFWWRGGRLTRKIFNWKVLPQSLARKAARQGGGKKIDGIIYPENYDLLKRNKALAWRASVESAVTVEQLALQIRELDANIKWEEIENTSHLAKMDKESIKSMRSFKKAIVRRKSSEGSVVKYLLDFGKRRFIPDVVVKHGVKIEEASSERKKYWVEEPFVPLFLLKTFEDKRISLKSNKVSLSRLSHNRRVMKPAKKDVFSYLLAKSERSENQQCGHCNENLPVRDAISCQYCEDFFHKRHVKKTSGGTYTCNKCNSDNTVKVNPKKGKSNSWKSKKVSKMTKKGGKRKQSVESQAKRKAFVVPLRRSSRTVKVVSFQSKKKPVKKKKYGGKKKQLKAIIDEVEKPKGKRGRPRKVKPSIPKKRSQMHAAYWLNGLLLSRKPDDKRVAEFRAKNHLVAFEQLDSISNQPKCCLCSEPEFRSSLNYINCETCGDWYHGDAFGLKDENIGLVISFKCHKCRDRAPPVCPHLHFASDKSELGEKKNDVRSEFGDEVSSEVLVKQNSDTIKEHKDLLSHDPSPEQQNAETGPGSKEDCAMDAQNGLKEDHAKESQNGPDSTEDHIVESQMGPDFEVNHVAENGPDLELADAKIDERKESPITHDESRVAVAQNGSLKAKESSTDLVD